VKKILFFLFLVVSLINWNQAFAATAKAILEGTSENSELIGVVNFRDIDEGLQVQVNIFGAAPGLHGIHIHETGSCSEGGKGAGGHFNPDKVKHGFLPTEGFSQAHAGDLGNIEINQNGEGTLFLIIPGLTIAGGKYNVEGKSVIFHEKKDDFGQPTGNAGGRVGCGIIQIDKK